jgi:hypothetical protein
MAIETWYLLKDGTYADPSECSTGKDGVLRHKNGMEVAMRDASTPSTSSVDADKQRKAPKQVPETIKAPDHGSAEVLKDVEPEAPKRHYKTRESKAE